MTAPDVFIPLREARREPDTLRYTLRALHQHVPHGRIWTVGYRPTWLAPEVSHVATEQRDSKFWNIGTNLMTFLRLPGPADRVLMMNDDMFCLSPVPDVPLMAREDPIDTYVDSLRVTGLDPHDAFVEGMHAQRDILRAWGYDTSDMSNLDGHFPVVVDRWALLGLMNRVAREFPSHPLGHYKMLLAHVMDDSAAIRMRDPKYKRVPDEWPAWCSVYRASWKGQVGEVLRSMFPEPCPYETIAT